MSGLLNGSFNVAANFFGVDVTINPLPVRLKVGDMYHLEPLVIKEYTIKMSQELYYTDVSYSGSPQVAALPMHVTVDIKFDWWMLPSPMRNVNKVFGMPLYNYKEDGSDTATAANFPWLKQHGYFS
jgi:hypothetical protein